MRKKLISSLLFFVAIGIYAQWTPTKTQQTQKELSASKSYLLDINALRKSLANAPLEGKNVTPVEIIIPDTKGQMHRFAVYSRPVVDEKLAQKYNLGSYIGTGIDDETLQVRFSLSGNDFQAMMMKDGKYEFIEPANTNKSVYSVFEKKTKTKDGRAFECTTTESIEKKSELKKLYHDNQIFGAVNGLTISASDRKFRTYRLAVAVTGEYGRMFGGVAGALTQINATMTRVNGVFEKDLAINLMLIENNDQLIYTNPDTDPFSGAANWAREVQIELSDKIGNNNYDIGHLFAVGGGGGNAGCNGCICLNPSLDNNGVPEVGGKGSGYTGTPEGGRPQGDVYDIDYVAHEIGHQLGANHTFSHTIHAGWQYRVHMEPNRGTTIMGYGDRSDAYFHTASLDEILANLRTKPDCGTHTNTTNTPPRITPLPEVSIPKNTAFALKAEATDNENDALTYTWEQVDNATSAMVSLSSEATTGPLFRSVMPSESPVRYFPNIPTIISGKLNNSSEVIPSVAREMNFRVTVRDNHPISQQQQIAMAAQKVKVIDAEPFTVTSSLVYNNGETTITWNAGKTASAPFNTKNVKIDYTTNNGTSWITLLEKTPNDGIERVNFPNDLPLNSTIFIRVSAVENVFLAVNKAVVSSIAPCDGSVPKSISVSGIGTDKAFLDWNLMKDAEYKIKYRNPWAENWTEATVSSTPFEMKNLAENSLYEVQIAAICNGIIGEFSDSLQFFTNRTSEYCQISSANADNDWISKVTVSPSNETIPAMNSSSSASPSPSYSDYRKDASRIVYLERGSTNNNITVDVAKIYVRGYKREGGLTIWIDFNGDGTYSTSERIVMTDYSEALQFSHSFSVPEDAYDGDKLVGMRVAFMYKWPTVGVLQDPCRRFNLGEIEDYSVKIFPKKETLNTDEKTAISSIKIYPNPATDSLNLQNAKTSAPYIIYNMAGQIVSQGNVADGKINIARLPKAAYIISVLQNGEKTNLKFIKN